MRKIEYFNLLRNSGRGTYITDYENIGTEFYMQFPYGKIEYGRLKEFICNCGIEENDNCDMRHIVDNNIIQSIGKVKKCIKKL
jgi:hypothetical protein